MLSLLLALACSPDPTAGADSGAAPASTVPDLPTGGCGLPEHAWLPLEHMGQLVDYEEADELSMTAGAVDALLAAAGLDAITPVEHGVRTFRVRYTTQDKGQPIEATGFVVLPDVVGPASLPVVLWQHPTTGFSDSCAPTALGFVGAAFPMLWASMGFAVAAPDYLGMAGWGEPSGRLHPWMVAEPTAVVSLDGARALLRFAAEHGAAYGLDLQPDPEQVLVWGASEGGFAALWADRYAGLYAPELTVTGVIAAIPPTDAAALATRGVTEFSATSAGIGAAAVTMADWYETEVPLSTLLNSPYDQTVPAAMVETCTDGEAAFPGAESVEDIFAPAFVDAARAGDWEAAEPWGCFLQASVLRDSQVSRLSTAPVLIVTAEDDDLAWPAPVHQDIAPLCGQGYVIEHIQCAGADHVSGAVQTLAYQLDWARAATDGQAPLGAETCVVSPPEDCLATYGLPTADR